MDTIIGLGEAGCNIAECFTRYKEYQTFMIDHEKRDHKNFLALQKQDTHEEYELKYQALDLSSCGEHIGLFCAGAGTISGALLRILEQLQDKKVWLYFIKSDPIDLTELGLLRERASFFILQEFARSDLLDKIYILDNKNITSMLSGVTVVNYWSKLNEFIASSVHILNYFKHIKPVMTTFATPPVSAKIQTLGIIDLETGEEKMFYDLKHIRHRYCYYSLSEESLNKDLSLLNKIKQQITALNTKISTSNYSIFNAGFDENFCYSELFTPVIQEQELPQQN